MHAPLDPRSAAVCRHMTRHGSHNYLGHNYIGHNYTGLPRAANPLSPPCITQRNISDIIANDTNLIITADNNILVIIADDIILVNDNILVIIAVVL